MKIESCQAPNDASRKDNSRDFFWRVHFEAYLTAQEGTPHGFG